jgi:malonate decarboxylase gamma subunit
MIHAMHKAAAARVTRRSVEELEKLAKEIAPMSYDIRDYGKLGLLYKLLHVENPEKPSVQDIRKVQDELIGAIADARRGPVDLRNRLQSKGAIETRKASLLVRSRLEAQWLEK